MLDGGGGTPRQVCRGVLDSLILQYSLESNGLDSDLETSSKGSRFKVYRIRANSSDNMLVLGKLYDEGNVDFWQKPNLRGNTDLMVDPKQELELLRLLKDHDMDHSVIIDDVDGLISAQKVIQPTHLKSTENEEINWTEYHYPETIFNWMDKLSKFYPDICKTYTIGISSEGKPLKLIKISSAGSVGDKLAVFIDATTHAREWITTAVSTYIINELVTNSSNYPDLLESYEFYILPMMNPDGYAHSCNYNRFWRKTRRSSESTLGDLFGCQGVDLNRNFGYFWGGPGSGSFTCSPTYRGLYAFSEPETAAIRDFVFRQPSTVKWTAYFSLHSYGQKWLSPWGFQTQRPDDFAELTRVARIGANALKSIHGTEFEVGNSQEVLYLTSGGSDDWFKGVVGCKYSYTLELRDSGDYGFLLPPTEIIPTSEETWSGIAAALRAILMPSS